MTHTQTRNSHIVNRLARKGLPRWAGIGMLCPKTIFSKRIVVVVVVVVGLGVRGEACSKRPARGELALASFAQNQIFPKELLLLLWLLLGLGVWGEACSKRPARGGLALASFAEAIFSKRIAVVVVVVVGLGGLGRSLLGKACPR